jgi:hypothetical protein
MNSENKHSKRNSDAKKMPVIFLEPPTLNQALANERGPLQLQRPLVSAPPSDNVPPTG